MARSPARSMNVTAERSSCTGRRPEMCRTRRRRHGAVAMSTSPSTMTRGRRANSERGTSRITAVTSESTAPAADNRCTWSRTTTKSVVIPERAEGDGRGLLVAGEPPVPLVHQPDPSTVRRPTGVPQQRRCADRRGRRRVRRGPAREGSPTVSLGPVTVLAAAALSAGIAVEALALVLVAACGLLVLGGLSGVRVMRAVAHALRA